MLRTFKHFLSKCLIIISVLLAGSVQAAGNYDVGVYYYPGWKLNEPGNWIQEPWSKIKPFPERQPLLGWYDESAPSVIAKQTRWMHQYGISYIIFDWYWGPSLRTRHEHALRNYLSLKDKSSVDFAIMWANHDESPKTFDEFKAAVNYWIQNYFSKPEYKRVDGAPIVYIFSALLLDEKAKRIGLTTPDLLNEANRIAISNGLPGIKFVGGAGAYDKFFLNQYTNDGYFAFSAYNSHVGKVSPESPAEKNSHSYDELKNGYQYHLWKWFFDNNKKYITPSISGWDKRPWGGSEDPLHDNSSGNVSAFKSHLIDAKNNADKSSILLGKKMVVICCWNEYGEGSIIEPTKSNQFDYLEAIKEVFAN